MRHSNARRPRASGHLVVANRTASRAQLVVDEFGGTVAPLGELAGHVASADIVLTATSAAEPILPRAELAPLLARRSRPLLVLDLGVPRDIEPSIGALRDVYLHDVDDLRAIADRGRVERAAEIRVERADERVAVRGLGARRGARGEVLRGGEQRRRDRRRAQLE